MERLFKCLRSGDFYAYELATERQGQLLASAGVPEEYAIAAMGFFYEACLPWLLGDRDNHDHAATLARLIAAGQICLVSGYANHRSASWWTMEEKLRRAEQHVQALATHVTEAYEQERRRLSRDLHDEIGHDMAVLKLYLEMLSEEVARNGRENREVVAKKLDEAIHLTTKAIEAVRRLAFDLGPGIFDELGFVPAIRFYVRRFSARTGIKVRVRMALGDWAPSNRVKMTLYRVLQGALSNVLRHSAARHVKVLLRTTDPAVLMTVEDDGRGFSPSKVLADPRKAFGLQAMRQRVELVEGSLNIISPVTRLGRKRRGTRLEFLVPLSSRGEGDGP
jgi:signal transduction histidine kinase